MPALFCLKSSENMFYVASTVVGAFLLDHMVKLCYSVRVGPSGVQVEINHIKCLLFVSLKTAIKVILLLQTKAHQTIPQRQLVHFRKCRRSGVQAHKLRRIENDR